MTLSREEYIEQAHFFRTMRERLALSIPMQELMASLREEVLSTTNLPYAIDFLLSELLHEGVIAGGMQRLNHYFTPFQAYVVSEAENDRGRFDLRVGLEILEREAEYLSGEPTAAGVFLFQFETLCRNRLQYDQGLKAIAGHPIFSEEWRQWILTVRRQIGLVELSDLIYVRSEYYRQRQSKLGMSSDDGALRPILFGQREGKIALAHRQKEPLLLLSALQRHLGYPAVPRQQPADETVELIPQMARRMERLEARLKLLEEESREGLDITKFYIRPQEGGQTAMP